MGVHLVLTHGIHATAFVEVEHFVTSPNRPRSNVIFRTLDEIRTALFLNRARPTDSFVRLSSKFCAVPGLVI